MVTPEKEIKRARVEGAIDTLLLLHRLMWISAFDGNGEEVRSLTLGDLAREEELDNAIHARHHLYVDDSYSLHWRKVDGENLLDGNHYNTLTILLATKAKELHALDSESDAFKGSNSSTNSTH